MNAPARILAAAAVAVAAHAASAAAKAPAQPGPVEVDGVAATVGPETILKSDVIGEMARAGAAGGEEEFRRFARTLAERKLILRAAKEAKTTMQDWVVDDRIRTITENAFGGDRNKLVSMLARDRLSYAEWRARIKEDLIISAMKWNVVDRNVRVSPAAMQREFAGHPERYRSEELQTLAVILLKPSDAGKAEEISRAIAAAKAKGEAACSAAFSDMAKRHSADSRAQEGGVWKDVRPEEVFKSEICQVAKALPVGGISPWTDLGGWKFLVRKISVKGGGRKTFAEAYEDVERNVRQAESERLYREWMERLEAETPVNVK